MAKAQLRFIVQVYDTVSPKSTVPIIWPLLLHSKQVTSSCMVAMNSQIAVITINICGDALSADHHFDSFIASSSHDMCFCFIMFTVTESLMVQ